MVSQDNRKFFLIVKSNLFLITRKYHTWESVEDNSIFHFTLFCLVFTLCACYFSINTLIKKNKYMTLKIHK